MSLTPDLWSTIFFVGFQSLQILGQYVDSVGLATSEEKIKAINRLVLPNSLRKLEIYLGLTG